MKLTKIDTETGNLAVLTNRGSMSYIEFPLKSIFDWYPCCQRYDYRMSTNRNKLYLVPIEGCEGKLKYNVSSSKNRVDSEIGVVNIPKWYNKEVSKDNKQVFQFATSYDIITPKENYTLEDVQESITKVLDILDMLYKFEYNKLREHYMDLADAGELVGREKEAYDSFVVADREDRAHFVLQDCDDTHIDTLFEKFGEVYTMLNVMRKVVE